MHVSDSAIAHGNERQDMKLGVAGRCAHGRRITESAAAAGRADAGQRLSSQATITSTTSATSTNVTCDRGIPVFRLIRVLRRCAGHAASPGYRDPAVRPALTR